MIEKLDTYDFPDRLTRYDRISGDEDYLGENDQIFMDKINEIIHEVNKLKYPDNPANWGELNERND